MKVESRSVALIWVFLALFVAALAIYALRFQTATQPGVSHDDAEYLVLAESFATGKPYRLINYPAAPLETTWPPGYPLLVLSVPWLLFGPNITLLRALNLVMVAISAVAGYKLLKIYLDPLVALMVVTLFVLSPKTVGLATVTMSDTAFICFLLLFLLIFIKWESRELGYGWGLLLSIVLLTASILIRYVGIAFLAAAFIYLVLRRDYKRALFLGGGTTLLIALFPLFLLMQADGKSDSYLVLNWADNSIMSHLTNIRISLFTYWKATPLLLVPILGPNVTERLGRAGLGWSGDIIHSLIMLLCLAGLGLSFVKQHFIILAIICYTILLLLFTDHVGSETLIFNEPRYLMPILLFLYAGLLLGVESISRRFLDISGGKVLMSVVFAILTVILIARNIQQSQAEFPVADLSAGALWAQTNTDKRAIFMTPDPVSRYIYLRRQTTGYPVSDEGQAFSKTLRAAIPDYLLIAPPLRLGTQANTEQLTDPWTKTHAIPFIEQSPECFPLVYKDENARTYIYRVVSTCPLFIDDALSQNNRDEDQIETLVPFDVAPLQLDLIMGYLG